jgi:hypothetical protein
VNVLARADPRLSKVIAPDSVVAVPFPCALSRSFDRPNSGTVCSFVAVVLESEERTPDRSAPASGNDHPNYLGKPKTSPLK